MTLCYVVIVSLMKAEVWYRSRGDDLFMRNQYDEAIEAYTEALRMDKEMVACLVNRAACKLQIGDATGAATDATAAIDLLHHGGNIDSLARAHVRRGVAYAAMGELRKALDDFEAASNLRPKDEQLQKDVAALRAAQQ